MNAWIILLFLLMGNCNSDCSGRSGRGSRRSDGDCGCDNDRNRGRDRDGDRDCGCNDSRFEPRFDSRPFRDGRETCGCEEKED